MYEKKTLAPTTIFFTNLRDINIFIDQKIFTRCVVKFQTIRPVKKIKTKIRAVRSYKQGVDKII